MPPIFALPGTWLIGAAAAKVDYDILLSALATK